MSLPKSKSYVVFDTTLFLLEDVISESACSLLTERTSAVGIALSLLKNIVFAIFIF
jgi:hypothetical protein